MSESPPTQPSQLGRIRPSRLLALVAAVAVVGALAGASRLRSEDRRETPLGRAEVRRLTDAAVDEAVQKADEAPNRPARVFDSIVPSVVVIEAHGQPGGDGLGTGVVVRADGRILTALHVVEGAARLELTFADGTKAAGSIENADPDNDIAVLTADRLPEVVVPAVLGGGLDVGDEVIAVGHPLGLVASLSDGVVSGLEREMPVEGGRRLQHLIQFDAAVNPGSSGGPLLDRDGRVVGIVTALANPSAQKQFIGIGFAVPIRTAGGAAGAPPR